LLHLFGHGHGHGSRHAHADHASQDSGKRPTP
jgi:hypothetical protein